MMKSGSRRISVPRSVRSARPEEFYVWDEETGEIRPARAAEAAEMASLSAGHRERRRQRRIRFRPEPEGAY